MQLKHYRWLILVSLILLLIPAAFAQSPIPVTTVDQLNVRTGPGAEYEKIGTIPINSNLFMEARNIFGNWVIVSTPNGSLRGWVASRFLLWDDELFLGNVPLSQEIIGGAAPQPPAPDNVTPIDPPANLPDQASAPPLSPDAIIGTVQAGTLYVRTGPGTEYDRIDSYRIKQEIIVLGRNYIGNWLLTRSLDGQTAGWVASRYIEWADDEFLLASLPVTGQIIGLNSNTETALLEPGTVPVPGVLQQDFIIPADALIGTSLASGLNIRTGPGTEFARMDSLALNEDVVVQARNNIGNWLLIQPVDGGTRGWVASRYVTWEDDEKFLEFVPESTEIIGVTAPDIPAIVTTPAAPVPDLTPIPNVTASAPLLTPNLPPIANPIPAKAVVAGLNVRISDSIESAIIDSLNNNEPVIIEARNFIGNWMLIRREDGSTRGWVASRYLAWDDEVLISDIPVYTELADSNAVAPVPIATTPTPAGN